MELRAYWRILCRRWWLAAATTAVAALLTALTSPWAQGGAYTATLRVLLGVQSGQPQGAFTYDGYYSLMSTEFLTDDFVEVVKSQSFHDKVLQEMTPPPQGPISVSAPTRTERAPRVVTINVSAPTEAEARGAGEAAARVATNRIGEFFPQLRGTPALSTLIDAPTVAFAGAASRNYVNILLRALAGLIVGLGLVFLLHYLDDRLYEPEEVEEQLGIPVLADLRRR